MTIIEAKLGDMRINDRPTIGMLQVFELGKSKSGKSIKDWKVAFLFPSGIWIGDGQKIRIELGDGRKGEALVKLPSMPSSAMAGLDYIEALGSGALK